MGDGISTWTNPTTRAYWPDMISHDRSFDGFDIYVYEYPTPRLARAYSPDEVAENMRLLFNTDHVLEHDQIVFLAHSLGGIATRAYLLKYRKVADHVTFLYFFSVPTTGSEMANLGAIVSKNPQFASLRIMDSSSYLADLQRQWLAADFKFHSYCAYESRPTYGQAVVTQASATNLCNRPLDPIDADHIDIVKPEDARSSSYLAFRDAFEQEAAHPLEAATKRTQTSSKRSGGTAGAGPRRDAHALSLAVGRLTELGWMVDPYGREANPQVPRFMISANSAVPPAEESLPYLRTISKPFLIGIFGVQSIDGLAPLGSLANLRYLRIFNSVATSFTALGAFRSVSTIEMSSVEGAGDITPLSNLPNLENLTLQFCPAIRDLSPLGKVEKLRTLNLGYTNVTDISPLRGLNSLAVLNIANSKVTDLSPLEGLPALEELSITREQLATLGRLAHMPSLKRLHVEVNGLDQADLSVLGSMSNISELSIVSLGSTLDIGSLRNLGTLSKLFIQGIAAPFGRPTVVENLESIGSLRSLRSLNLFGVSVPDIGFLGNLQGLTELVMTYVSGLQNIQTLSTLPNLEIVGLQRTQVSDITPLLNLTKLKAVDARGTPARSDTLTELTRRGVAVQTR
jgi:Leucine-rich repeat (LRR) protein